MSAIQLSKDLQQIAAQLDDLITASAGKRVAFTLLVFTDDRASYISTASREESVSEIKELLALWDAGMPDVPAHKIM